jgi:uncharacterized protein (TIGR02588 family)
MMAKARSKAPERKSVAPPVPLWEWLVAALGLLLVVGMVGLLLYEAASESAYAPDVTLEANTPIKLNSGWHLTIQAVNRGDKAAAQLTIAAELRDKDSQVVETAELTFDYLAPHSSRTGGVYFINDPAKFQLQLASKSYVSP